MTAARASAPPGAYAVFRSLPTAAQVLIANQFLLAFGFSLVLPFLAVYLTKDLRLAPALVGSIVGLRTLSQQGMFLFGGSLSDKFGPRPMIMAGCGLRAISFFIFASSTALPAIILATVCAGLGSAFFNPAVRAYLAAESESRRTDAFSLLNIASNVGALIGPVIGGALLAVNFRVVCGAGCGLYIVAMVIQFLTLPARKVDIVPGGMISSWIIMAKNRPFLVFTVSGAIFTFLYNQTSFALVVEATRVTGRAEAVTAVFLVSTITTMLLQVRLVHWFGSRWDQGKSLAIGTVIVAVGWLPIAIAAPLLSAQEHALPLGAALLHSAPVLFGTALMAIGSIIVLPYQMELLAVVGSDRLLATYYGFFSMIGGIATALGSAALGAAFAKFGDAGRWIPYGAMLLLGVAASAIIVQMRRRGQLDAVT